MFQDIDRIPCNIKALYKTVWEISQKVVIDMAADRGPYIDQSQSLNIHIAETNYKKLSSMHFYGWRKVGIRYNRHFCIWTSSLIFLTVFKGQICIKCFC